MSELLHSSPRLRRLAAAALATGLLCLGGCASSDRSRTGLFEPYRIDLPQGNYITQTTLDRVRVGMSAEQVRDVLGAPLLGHIFHSDRWDYVFRFTHPSGATEQRKVTVRFREGRVSGIEADPLPQREDPADPALPGFKLSPRKP